MDCIEPGRRFGDLDVLEEIGRGAFGQVYVARDTLIGRKVALKVLRTPDGNEGAKERERALTEARFMGGIQSPHLVTLYRVHAFPDGGGWVFEMEYVDGGTLEDLLGDDRALEPERALEVMQGILRGLRLAHRSQILHGDVKPGNVMLDQDGNVKLADFGLARLLGEASLTGSSGGEMLGTPRYMAPELIMGEQAGIAADIWSAGVVLYRLLSGRLPFANRNLNNLFVAIQNRPPAPLDPHVPPELQRLVLQCLAKRPENRPASADELLEAIERIVRSGSLRALEAASQGSPRPELFGREPERAGIGELLAAAQAGDSSTLLVTGEEGVGKTALLEDAASTWRREGLRWIDVGMTRMSGLMGPLVGAVRETLQEEGGVEEQLDAGVFGPETPIIRQLLGPESELATGERTAFALVELLKHYAAARPLAICIEDVHLACDQEARLIGEFSRLLAGSHVLLALSYRTFDPESSRRVAEGVTALRELRELASVRRFDLEPLAPQAICRLLETHVDGARIAPDVSDRIVRGSGGNPLFAIEMHRHLEACSGIVREGDELVPGPAWDDATPPRRVRDLMLRRLDDLPEQQRALLDVAAVDGVQFDGEAVAVALDRPLLRVLRELQRLCRERGLITPRQAGYRFTHTVLQACIYEETAADLRRALHERLAKHLEQRGDEVDPARLGLHWDRAGYKDKARPHLRRAALLAARREEYMRAIEFARMSGIAATEVDHETALDNVELLLALAGCYDALGDKEVVNRIHGTLRDAAAASGDDALRLRMLVRDSYARWRQDGPGAVDTDALSSAAAALPACAEVGRAYELLGRIAKNRGRWDEALRSIRRADRVFSTLGLDKEHSGALGQLASVHLRAGQPAEAERLFAEAARISRAMGQRTNAAANEVARARAALERGALDGLAPMLEQSVRELALCGARDRAAQARVTLAQVHYAEGRLLEAFRLVRDARAQLERSGYLPGLVDVYLEEALLAGVRGNMGQAREAQRAGVRAAVKADHLEGRVRAAALEAQHLCLLADAVGAAAAARSARDLATRATEAAIRCDLALWLLECALFGLPEAALMPAAEGPVELRDALRGARVFAAGADNAPALHRAADVLGGSDIGERRAALRIAGLWYRTVARRAEGDRRGAAGEAHEGLAAARALGHVWFEANMLRLLGELLPGEPFGTSGREVIERVAGSVEESADRRRLLEGW